MRIKWLFLMVICLFGALHLSIAQSNTDSIASSTNLVKEDAQVQLLNNYNASLRFQENKGQWDNDAVLFRANNHQASFQFTPKGVSIGILKKETEESKKNTPIRPNRNEKITRDTVRQTRDGFVWNLNFLGGNSNPEIMGKHPHTGKFNYINGERSKDISNISSYQEIWYESVYDNIDARFYSSNEEQLEYDFIVHPNGQVADIHLEMEGIKDLSVNQNGEIVFQTPMGELKKGKPYTYQKINGQQIEITSRYVLEADNSIRFEVGDYDPEHELVIDPIVLAYSTYLGALNGNSNISIASMTLDSDGNVIVVGSTSFYNLPVTPGTIQASPGADGFIFKLDPSLGTVIWGTYYSGSSDFAWFYILDVAVDATNNVYISGRLRTNNLSPAPNPATPGAWQENPLSYDGGFAAKLSADGASLDYFTYITADDTGGSPFTDVSIMEIDVDAAGTLVAVGYVDGIDFPTSPGVVQSTFQGGGGDWVVVSLNNTGGLHFSTYLGGTDWEYNESVNIEIGPGGNIYVSGTTYGWDYPTTAGVFGETATSPGVSGERGVISVLNPSGTAFVYSTYINDPSLTHSGFDALQLHDMKVDLSGNAYVTGLNINDFSFTSGSFSQLQNTGFLVKMDASGQRVFSTALTDKPSEYVEGLNLDLDDENNIYVLGRAPGGGGYTATPDGLNQDSPHSWDNYLLMLSADGSTRLYGTDIITNDAIYWGYNDRLIVEDCKLYMSGNTGSVHTNVTPSAFKTIKGSGENGFISLFDLAAKSEDVNTISPASQNVCSSGRTQVISGTDLLVQGSDYIKNGVSYAQILEVSYQWQASNDSIVWENIPGAVAGNFLPTPTTTNVYYRRISGTNICDRDTSNVHSVIVSPDAAPTVVEGFVNTCPGVPVQIGALASGGTGGPYTYIWSPSSGLSDPAIAQPTVTSSTGGTYNVLVTDTGNGCEFEEQWQVKLITADAGPDVDHCAPVAPVVIGTARDPDAIYSWSVISGDPISSLSNPNIPQPLASPSVATTYELTVSSPTVGCSLKDTVVVGNLTVTADAGLDATLCLGEDYVLGGEAAQAGYTYVWTPGVYISSQTAAQPTFQSALCFEEDIYPQTNNPMQYTLTKIDIATGCWDIDTIKVNLLHTKMGYDLCGVPQTIGFQEDSCGFDLPGVNFTWSVLSGDAASIIGQENDRYPIVSPSVFTHYQLGVELNGKSCFSELNVHLDCAGSCNVDIDVSSDITCPIGGSYNTVLDGTATMLGGANGDLPAGFHFEWFPSFGLDTPGSLTTTVSTIPQDTTYYLRLIDESDGSIICSDSVRVYASLASNPFEDLTTPNFVCEGEPKTIGLPSVAGWSYNWNPSTNLSDPNISNPVVNTTDSRTYQLKASDVAAGCVISTPVEVVVKEPIINAGADKTFCENAIVELGSPAIPGQTYSWEPAFGLAQPNIAQPLDTLFISAQFVLTVTDTILGCTAVDTVNYTLTTPPTVDAGPDTTICAGGGGIVIGPAFQVGFTYQWTPTDGLSDPNIAQPTASPAATTTYTLLVYNGNAGCNTTDDIVVTVGPAYSLTVNSVETCPSDSVSIGVVGAGGTYSWAPTIGLGNPNASQTNALPNSTTTYTLTWLTPDGCSVSDDAIVTILPLPDVTASDVTICEGQNTFIGPFEESGVTYSWSSVSGDPVSTLSATNIARPTAAPSQTTVYRLTASSPTGCNAQTDVTVTVESNPVVDLGPDRTVCGIDTLDSGVGEVTYRWNTAATDSLLPISIVAPTSYSITVSNAAGCTDKDTISVSPTYEVEAGLNRGICLGESTSIGMADLGAGYTYTWTPATGLSSSTLSNPVANPSTTTTYTLTVDDGLGCIIEDEVTITVNPAPTLDFIPAQTICNGMCTDIVITPETGVSYYWSPSAGLSGTRGSTLTACPSDTTTYTITAVSAGGCAAVISVLINVNPGPLPIADAGTDQEVCSGETVQLGTAGAAGVTYYWSSPDAAGVTALSNPYLSNPSVTLTNTSNTPLVRTFIVEAVNNTSLCSDFDTVMVMVNPYPTININSMPTLCAGGGDINLKSSDISFNGNNLRYQWAPTSNVSDISAKFPTLTLIDSTVFTVIATDTLTGCADVALFSISVSDEVVSVDAGLDQSVCTGDSIRIGTPTTLEIQGEEYRASFEGGLDNWAQATDDNFNWTRRSGGTPTGSTGPSSAFSGSFYMYIETSGPSTGHTARLISPSLSLPVDIVDMSFYRHMYGSNMGELRLDVSTDGGTTWLTLWSISGDQGNVWNQEIVNISAYAGMTVQFSFVGVRGNGIRSDIAIDFINFPHTGAALSWASSSVLESGYTTNESHYVFGTNSSTAQPYVLSNSPSDSRYYRVQLISAAGCLTSDVVYVEVTGRATIDAGPNQFVCGDTMTTLNASDPVYGTAVWTQASGPNTATIIDVNSQTSSLEGLIAGTYVFEWTVSGSCNDGADVVMVQVVDAPSLSVVNACVNQGNTFDLTDASVTAGSNLNGAALSYWLDSATTIAVLSPTMVAPGTYYIKAQNPSTGCQTSMPVTITLCEICGNGIDDDGDGLIDWEDPDCAAYVASLGNYIWLDEDKDGIQDAAERGLSGVPVQLLNASGSVIAATQTDAFGAYGFKSLAPGAYRISVTPPANYTFAPADAGSNDTLDSDINPLSGISSTFILAFGDTNLLADAGLVFASTATISLGDYVWIDLDADDTQGGADFGFSGVTVSLFDNADNPVATTISDQAGVYLFRNLAPGTYKIGASLPAGVGFVNQTIGDATGSDIDPATAKTPTVTLVSGDQFYDLDIGLKIFPATMASIGDKVWNDLNQNGLQEAGEPGIPGVAVSLYGADGTTLLATTQSDAFGTYMFTGLAPGKYHLAFAALAGYTFTSQFQGADPALNSDVYPTGLTDPLIVFAGEVKTTLDAGMYQTAPAGTARIGDLVWFDYDQDGIQDPGEPGAPGLTVTLYNNADLLVAKTTSQQNGYYTFTELAAGSYYIVVDNYPEGFAPSPASQGGDNALDSDVDEQGKSMTIVLANGQNHTSLDAGIAPGVLPTGTASLGGRSWNDLNADGLQDAGELGIPGIQVRLYAQDGTTLLDSILSNALGEYIFTGLDSGTYLIEFVPATFPANYLVSSQDQGPDDALDSDIDTGTGRTSLVSLNIGQQKLTLDGGLYNPTANLSSIGDRVWNDLDADGIYETGEGGVAGVSVTLYTALGDTTAITTTDKEGRYRFADLPPGNYQVGFSNLPAGYTFSPQGAGANQALDSDVNIYTGRSAVFALPLNVDTDSIDAGITAATAVLGDYVWMDTNANGLQEAGETGIAGVTVTLLDAGSSPIGQAITDKNGAYLFQNLTAGTYSLQFSSLPAGTEFSPKDNTGNDTNDSDGDPATGSMGPIVLTGATIAWDWDQGVQPAENAGLGDYVWFDANIDGAQNNTEPGVSGAAVTLYDSGSNPQSIAISDAAGLYQFLNLAPGNYHIGITSPFSHASFTAQNAGSASEATDSDVATGTGISDPVSLSSNEVHSDLDAGLQFMAVLGGLVWYDDDRDGILSYEEALTTGVTVELLAADSSTVLQTTTTDAHSGNYFFFNLAGGDYFVRFRDLPATYGFTLPNAGGNDQIDSDAIPASTLDEGTSFRVSVPGGGTNLFTFAGLSNTPFDVEWLDFTVSPRGGDALLEWATAQENQAAHYEIERSVNGRLFQQIGQQAANGTTTQISQYQFLDPQITRLAGKTFFYRIRQVDLEGESSYSAVQELRLDQAGPRIALYASPVPVSDLLTLDYDLINLSAAQLEVFNSFGQKVHTQQVSTPKGSIELSVVPWSSGVYYLSMTGEEVKEILKIVVRH